MADGIEFVSGLITRYEIVEKLYLRIPSEIGAQLTKDMVLLYTAILKYLAEARTYYEKGTARTLKHCLFRYRVCC